MSIPKIIHLCWLSGDPYPDHIDKFIKGWQLKMPDYELMLWDAKKLEEIGKPRFAYEAYQSKKWAFAADYIRLYAVYHYGGIWLDSDIEVHKSLDCFLEDRMFIGWESWVQKDHSRFFTAHCFGAEPKHPFIKECLDVYEDRAFILNIDKSLPMEERFNVVTIPEIISDIAASYGFDKFYTKDTKISLKEGIKVYPSYYFCRPEYHSIEKVYVIHRCASSWREDRTLDFSYSDPKKKTWRYYIKKLLFNLGIK